MKFKRHEQSGDKVITHEWDGYNVWRIWCSMLTETPKGTFVLSFKDKYVGEYISPYEALQGLKNNKEKLTMFCDKDFVFAERSLSEFIRKNT